MSISLSSEVQAIIEERMRLGGYPSVDDLVRAAFDALSVIENEPLDDDEIAEIQEGIAQAERGEVVDWDEFSAPWRAKYLH